MMRTFRQWFSRSTATLSLKLFIMYQVWPAVERSTSCHDSPHSSHLLSWSSLRVAHYVSIVSSASQAVQVRGQTRQVISGEDLHFSSAHHLSACLPLSALSYIRLSASEPSSWSLSAGLLGDNTAAHSPPVTVLIGVVISQNICFYSCE